MVKISFGEVVVELGSLRMLFLHGLESTNFTIIRGILAMGINNVGIIFRLCGGKQESLGMLELYAAMGMCS